MQIRDGTERVRTQLEANDARWARFGDLPFEQWPEREKIELDLSNWGFGLDAPLSAAQAAAAVNIAVARPWFESLHRLVLFKTPVGGDMLAKFRACKELRDLICGICQLMMKRWRFSAAAKSCRN